MLIMNWLKKQLAAERAEAIRNKPPTRTKVRNMMITYLKHMGKYTHHQLKHKTLRSSDVICMRKKWIDDFKPIDDDRTKNAIYSILNENMMYYQIIRAYGSSKNYKIFSEMVDDFDTQDVIDPHRVAIHMMIEKIYPLTQEMLSRMLNRRLEVDYESEMAFELLRFTRSQLQKQKSVWIHPTDDQDADTEET
ncbi:hypothetical protein Tco_1547782 [Tanacetum coccineum]